MSTNTENLNEMFQAAAFWWLAKLTGIPADGIPGDSVSLGSMVAKYEKLKTPSGKERTEMSKAKFVNLIVEYLRKESENGGTTILSTDYGPEYPLSHFCHETEMSARSLPDKTVMWVNFNENTVTFRKGISDKEQVYPKN